MHSARLLIATLLCSLVFVAAVPTGFGQEYFRSSRERDNWVEQIRDQIRDCDRHIAEQERIVSDLRNHLSKYPNAGDQAMLRGHTKVLEDWKRQKARLEQQLRNPPPIRDIEAEQRQREAALRQQQILADRQAAEQRRQNQAAADQRARQNQAQASSNEFMDAFERSRQADAASRQRKADRDARRAQQRQDELELEQAVASEREASAEADRFSVLESARFEARQRVAEVERAAEESARLERLQASAKIDRSRHA